MPSVPDGLHVDGLTLDTSGLLITAQTTAAQACCRVCGRASARVHSRYWRTFDDLPWQDRSVTWRVQVRRFRCGHCPGRIFAERVPGLGARKARRNDRLAEAQTDIGMVLGGEAGARLSRRLAMPVSGDTVLGRDEPAVRAAIVEPWSNGPVEGQVNRLKLIKRSMYGRASFDLLRQRVLHAA
ncbi:transposase family protein [Methylobacterium sp. J-001]|uniref:transposase family protein n=1 Tax=Methylobacterium sp. J-001 TaxID=2836609 RepID=UPI00391A4804